MLRRFRFRLHVLCRCVCFLFLFVCFESFDLRKEKNAPVSFQKKNRSRPHLREKKKEENTKVKTGDAAACRVHRYAGAW